tara:strand:+ start:820 stop:1953 length:1134 start_codon:yes stop_codon:yes gene_type:complete
MPKWIGNRIGTGVTFVTDQEASSAVYNIFDQYYGKRIGGWVQAPGIKDASGGTLVSPNPGGMEIRHFPSTGSGSFTFTSATPDSELQVVVVGGGGGGGERGGGGGGGGGVIYWDSVPLSGLYGGPTTIPLSVGAGGEGKTNAAPTVGGDAGTPTTFANPSTQPGIYLVALGGGGGRSDSATAPNNASGTTSTPQQCRGGSGGGQHECSDGQVTDSNGVQTSDPAIPANSRTHGFGNPGGRSNPGDSEGQGCPLEAGGGGGAGSGRPGNDAPGPAAGSGGSGVGPPTIPWMPTSLGDSGYFGGGGGGGVHGPTNTGGSGGQGGGGASEGRAGGFNGDPGTNGTGGGGGGSSVNNSFNPESGTSGDGGNGIIVIRYPAA